MPNSRPELSDSYERKPVFLQVPHSGGVVEIRLAWRGADNGGVVWSLITPIWRFVHAPELVSSHSLAGGLVTGQKWGTECRRDEARAAFWVGRNCLAGFATLRACRRTNRRIRLRCQKRTRVCRKAVCRIRRHHHRAANGAAFSRGVAGVMSSRRPSANWVNARRRAARTTGSTTWSTPTRNLLTQKTGTGGPMVRSVAVVACSSM